MGQAIRLANTQKIPNVGHQRRPKRRRRTIAATNQSGSSRNPLNRSHLWATFWFYCQNPTSWDVLSQYLAGDVKFKLKNLINHDPCTTRTCWHIIVICEHVSCRQRMHLHPFAFSILTNKYFHLLNAFRLLQCFADILLSWAPHICKGWSAKPGCCAAVHLTSESKFVQAIYDAETTCDLARGCVKFNPPGNWCKSLHIEGWSCKEKLSCLVPSRYEYALSSQPFERGQAENMTTHNHI